MKHKFSVIRESSVLPAAVAEIKTLLSREKTGVTRIHSAVAVGTARAVCVNNHSPNSLKPSPTSSDSSSVHVSIYMSNIGEVYSL